MLWRKAGCGAIRFMLPATASTMTAAIRGPMLGKSGFESGAVVVVEDQGVAGEIGRNASRTRIAESQHPRAGLHQQTVRMAVIAAFELDQQIAPGEAARQADRAHRRFGPGAHQTDHFERGQQGTQELGHLDLTLGRRAEGESSRGSLLDGGDHLRLRMAKDQRSPRADVIEIGPAIGIGDAGTRPGGEKARRPADRPKGPDRRVDTPRDVPLGALKELLIAGTHAFFSSNSW
jgi:hypothetical protein